MVVNRSNLHVGQTVFFVHKEYNSLTKMKEDSIVECKITKIGQKRTDPSLMQKCRLN